MKNIFITGASSGIGKAIGEYLQNRGFTVIGTSRNPERVTSSAFPLVKLDVRNTDSIKACIAGVLNDYGHIDVLINNAGVGITGPLEEIPLEEIRNNFETNLFGPIEVMKAVLPGMRERRSGRIINITSIAGYMGLPFRSVYSASKGALEIISEGISMEVKGFGIDLVCIAPGDFATNIAAGRYHAPLVSGSAYESTYGETLRTMNEHVDSGSDPRVMADAILAIINEKKPRLHYKVGAFLQKFSIVLKRALPDRMYEKMLMRHYKL